MKLRLKILLLVIFLLLLIGAGARDHFYNDVLIDGNLSGADLDISAGTGDYSSSGTITSGDITIFNASPILIFKDSTSAGSVARGIIEWRDLNHTRLGYFGNSSEGNDDLLWKNESSGGHIQVQTTGAGEFQIFANTVLNGTLASGTHTPAAGSDNLGGLSDFWNFIYAQRLYLTTTAYSVSKHGAANALSFMANSVEHLLYDTGLVMAVDTNITLSGTGHILMDADKTIIPIATGFRLVNSGASEVCNFQLGNDTTQGTILQFPANTPTQVNAIPGAFVDFTFFVNSADSENKILYVYGFPTGIANKYGSFQMVDIGGANHFQISTEDAIPISIPRILIMDEFIAFDVNSGLTASTTQSQGQGALTAQVNEISIVANDGDTVTLPSAITGITTEIINNGAETLQIFPASGDDLGLGANNAEELETNERVKFVAYDTTNWAKESTTEIIHAEIHDEDNTDAFVINDAGGDFHSYHTNGLASGDLADWAFDAGGAGTSHAITSIADGVDSGNDIEVTTGDNHLLAVGDIVSQTNLADAAYVGVFEVKAIISATQYEVAAAFTADGTGTMDQAATLEADAVAAGVYDFAYYISATPVGNNETFDFQLHKEATAITGSKIRRKFGAGGDFGSMSGGGVVPVANGDKISFALSNEDSSANLVIRNLTIVLIRL